MRTRHAIGCGAAALILLALCLSSAGAQTLVKAAPGAVEVKASHGRTWVAFPDPVFRIRMDRNGTVTATAAPISVAHEDAGAGCTPVTMVAVASSRGTGSRLVTFTPAPRCSFDAADATVVLPMDSAAKFAGICNAPWRTVEQPQVCSMEANGQWKCQPMIGVPAQLLPIIGPAWRRAEGWTGRVPFNGVVHVDVGYTMANGIDHARDVPNPGVEVTCEAVPCVTWMNFKPGSEPEHATLPEARSGQPYRVLLFAGARQPLTFDTARPPAGLALGQDGYLSGTPTKPGSYEFVVGFNEAGACPWNMYTKLSKGGPSRWSQSFVLNVKDGEPPVIAAFATSADTLASGGGDVTVTLQLSDNVGVTKVLSTRVGPAANHTAPLSLTAGSAASGTWKITWPVPANTSTAPASYTIKAWAVDAAGNMVNASPKTVVVGVPGAALPRLPTRP